MSPSQMSLINNGGDFLIPITKDERQMTNIQLQQKIDLYVFTSPTTKGEGRRAKDKLQS